MRGPRGQLAVAAGYTVLGALVLWGAMYLPTEGGYAQVGPGVVPRVVGGILIVLGLAMLREALTGGFRGHDEEAEARMPMDWRSFAWVSGGILGYGLLIEHLGVSLRRILIGSAVGVAGGLALGLVMGTVTWIRVVATPRALNAASSRR